MKIQALITTTGYPLGLLIGATSYYSSKWQLAILSCGILVLTSLSWYSLIERSNKGHISQDNNSKINESTATVFLIDGFDEKDSKFNWEIEDKAS